MTQTKAVLRCLLTTSLAWLVACSVLPPQQSQASTAPRVVKACVFSGVGGAGSTNGVSCSKLGIGDLVVAFLGSAATTNTWTDPTTNGTGAGVWTAVTGCTTALPETKSTNSTYVYTHTVTSTDNTTSTFNWTEGSAGSVGIVMVDIRYANTAAPIDACNWGTFASSASPSSATVATSVVNDMPLVNFGNINSSDPTSAGTGCVTSGNNTSNYRTYVESCSPLTGTTGTSAYQVNYGVAPTSGGVDGVFLIAPASSTYNTAGSLPGAQVGGPFIPGAASTPPPSGPTGPYPATASHTIAVYQFMGSQTAGNGNNDCAGSLCVSAANIQILYKYIEGQLATTWDAWTNCSNSFFTGTGCLGLNYRDAMDVACGGSGGVQQNIATYLDTGTGGVAYEGGYTHTGSPSSVANRMQAIFGSTGCTISHAVNTNLVSAVTTTGSQTVSLGSSTGLAVGEVLNINLGGTNAEDVKITALSGSNVTANFTKTHAANVPVVSGNHIYIYPNYADSHYQQGWKTYWFQSASFVNNCTYCGTRWDNMTANILPQTNDTGQRSVEYPLPGTVSAAITALSTNRKTQASFISAFSSYVQAANFFGPGSGQFGANDATGSAAMIHNWQENVDDFCNNLPPHTTYTLFWEKPLAYQTSSTWRPGFAGNFYVMANTMSDFWNNPNCAGIDVFNLSFTSENGTSSFQPFRDVDKAVQMLLQDPGFDGTKSDRQYGAFQYATNTAVVDTNSYYPEDQLVFVPDSTEPYRAWTILNPGSMTDAQRGGCNGTSASTNVQGGMADLLAPGSCSAGKTDWNGRAVGLYRRDGYCYLHGSPLGHCTAFLNIASTSFTVLDTYCKPETDISPAFTGCNAYTHYWAPTGNQLQFYDDNSGSINICGASTTHASLCNGVSGEDTVANYKTAHGGALAIPNVGTVTSPITDNWNVSSDNPALILLP